MLNCILRLTILTWTECQYSSVQLVERRTGFNCVILIIALVSFSYIANLNNCVYANRMFQLKRSIYWEVYRDRAINIQS